MATLNYKQVIEYFDEVSADMAELVVGMIQDNLEAKAERKAKISANLKKARAARGKPEQAVATAQPVHRSPGRPRRVDTHIDPNEQLAAAATE